jgi:hypothetical protein
MTISDEVRRALVEVFGSVPQLPVPRSNVSKVKLALACELFGKPFANEDILEKFLDRRKLYARHNLLNRYLIEVTGVGPSLFTVTSLSHPDMEPSAETTLLDFDRAHFGELEETISQAQNRDRKPYRESLYGLWTRSMVDDELVYSFLWAAGPFLWTALEGAMFEWVDDNFQLRTRLCGTPEAQAADIRRQMITPEPHEKSRNDAYNVGSRLINTMLNEEGRDRLFDGDGPWVMRTITNDGREVRHEIVLSNARAMELVRFGTFYEDITALPDGTAEFEYRLSSLIGEFQQRLNELAFAQKEATVD